MKKTTQIIGEYVERNDVKGLAEYFRAYLEDEASSNPKFNINETILYRGKERKIICIDDVENLYGLEATWEPEDTVWVRKENCQIIIK